jgi:hypothetical protein
MGLKTGYANEQPSTVQMSDNPDSKEALVAFRQQREPVKVPLSAARQSLS